MPKLTVIASHAPTMRSLKQAELASYQCGSCRNDTVALAGCDPFCSHCGSPTMKERKQSAVASVFASTEEPALTSAQCSHCTMANVMLDSELAQMPLNEEGHVEICCVECGTGMHFNPDVTLAGADDSETTEEEDKSDWAWDDDKSPEEATAENSSEEDESEEEEWQEPDPSEEEEEEESEEEEASADDNPMIIMPKQKPVVASAEEDETEEESEEGSETEEAAKKFPLSAKEKRIRLKKAQEEQISDLEEEIKNAPEDKKPALKKKLEGLKELAEVIQSTQNPDYCDEPEDMNIDMLDAITASVNGEDASIAFIPLPDKILANVNDQTVAVLRKTAETANADIFGEPSYMEALAHSFTSNGLEPTLASYGFERNSFKAPKSVAKAFVQEKAKAVAAAETASVFEQHVDKFSQCLQLATAGMSRGLFTKVPHVIKDRLTAELTTAGVQDAQGLVERVLASTEDEHNQAVLTLAHTLSARDSQSLNDLAETIASLNPVGSSSRSQATASARSIEESFSEPLHKKTVTTASLLPSSKPQGKGVVRQLASSGTLFAR